MGEQSSLQEIAKLLRLALDKLENLSRQHALSTEQASHDDEAITVEERSQLS